MTPLINAALKKLGDERDRILRLSREGAWIVAGQIASVVGALVLVRVLTEYLKPAEYGELALGLTIAGLVNQVVMGGIGNGIGRFYSIALEKRDLWGYLHASRRLMGFAILAVGVIALALMTGLLAIGQTHWLGLVAAVLVFSILSGVNSSLSGIQNAARQRSIVALHSGLDAWLKIGLAAGVMLWLGANSTAAVIGYALSALLITISQLFFLMRLLHERGGAGSGAGEENWTRQMWSFSWPFSTWGVFTWAQQVSDRWALESFASTQDVGQYAVVFQLGYAPIGMVTGLLMALLGPILYQRSGSATDHGRNISVHRIAWRITQMNLAATVVGFSFTWLFHAWLFHWLVSEAFRPASHYLPWMVLAGGLFFAGQMLNLKFMSEIKPAAMITVKSVTSIIGVGLNIYCAARFGLPGAVAALVGFSSIYFLWMSWLTQYLPE